MAAARAGEAKALINVTYFTAIKRYTVIDLEHMYSVTLRFSDLLVQDPKS
jgi:hypothetical protein